MGRYSPSGLNAASIFDALAQVDTRTEEQRALDRASAAVLHAARREPRQPLPFSEAALPRANRRCRRGTTNRDDRGNTTDRYRRKVFLLETFGDGEKAPCYRCGRMLDILTITVDRKIPKRDGGRYTRNNIRPACGDCNSETGGMLATETGRCRLAAEEEARSA